MPKNPFRKRVNKLSPASLIELQESYKADSQALGLHKNILFSSDAFDQLVKVRIQKADDFFKDSKDSKDPNDATIKTNLIADKALQAQIRTALLPAPEYSKAQKGYSESIEYFIKLLKQKDQNYKPQDLIATFVQIKESAILAIKAQHTLELAKINGIADGDIVSLDPGVDVGVIKEKLVTELQASHTKQLKAFEDSTTKTQRQLHDAQTARTYEFLLIAHLHKEVYSKFHLFSTSDMYKKFHELLSNNTDRDPEANEDITSLEVGFTKDKINLSGITLEDLGNIETMTGKTLTRHVTDKGVVSYSMPMSSYLFRADPRENVMDDMVTLAQAIRASGHSRIKMTLTFDDKDIAEERGRQAYEACILAGYAPEKICISVNGQDYVAKSTDNKDKEVKTIKDHLFKDHPQTYDKLQKQSENIKKELLGIVNKRQPPSTEEGIHTIKEAMQKIRQSAAVIQEEQPQTIHQI